MGYNTVVLFLNDTIQKATENASETMNAICARAGGAMDDERLKDYSFSVQNHYYLPYGIKIPTIHHADTTVLLAIGGNYATKLHETYGWSHHEEKDQVRILKEWADKLGYNISKKRKK